MIHGTDDVVNGATKGDDGQHGRGCGGCSLFLWQFGALVRKNFLLQRRAPFQLIFELAVPAAFMALLAYIKSFDKIEKFGAGIPVDDTPVPTYDDLQTHAAYPNVLCFDNNIFLRCGCHTDSIGMPGSYLSGSDISDTGPAMWATAHHYDVFYSYCFAASQVLDSGSRSLPSSEDQCTVTKFTQAICAVVFAGSDDDSFSNDISSIGVLPDADVEEACGAGEALAILDLNATAYVELIVDTITLLADQGINGDYIIPEADIENVCQALILAVMPEDEDNGVEEATAFLSYVQAAYPDTASHWQAVDSEKAFVGIIEDNDYAEATGDDVLPGFSAGIVFSSGDPDWNYKIRTNSTKMGDGEYWSYDIDNVPSTRSSTDKLCKEPTKCSGGVNPWTSTYHQSAVLALQQLVDNWIISRTVSEDEFSPPVVRLSEFPHAQYQTTRFWDDASFAFAILVVMSVMYSVANVIGALVKEKELRIREGLKMMGLTSLAHTTSWVFHFACVFFFTTVFMIWASQSLFEHSDSSLIFLYLFVFFMATTSFCFFISAFFSRAKTGSMVGTLIFFGALFPYFSVSSDGATVSEKRAACLLPPTCLALGVDTIAEFEEAGLGVTSETAGSSGSDFSFNDAIGMLILDVFIFAALTWYAGNVLPSEWGTSRKPWFIFSKSYWCPGIANREAMASNVEALNRDESDNMESVEEVSDELKAQVSAGQCVALRGLSKVYKSSTGGAKLAVDKLDLTMYSGHITALLGHNGAGKTTTIAMLTGMTPSTSGSAFVAGRDMSADMANIRQTLGVCPQHDILYPDLTVREHLRMYAVLKGVPSSSLQGAIKTTILDVGLTEKENERTKRLSGGQKRKLSVGIALIGGSKVVFLDEPTSGMDPHSRRFTWDLIRKNREGRVIVLTTHFMDEADLLGDRVAIMADGKLKCCGSSLFLKKHYGVGYNLTIVRSIGEGNLPADSNGNGTMHVTSNAGVAPEEKLEDLEEGGQKGAVVDATHLEKAVMPITKLVRSHVKASILLSDVGAEVSFQLPQNCSPLFKSMLLEMDSRKNELGINSYGMSVTTLEEVFLKVAADTSDYARRDDTTGTKKSNGNLLPSEVAAGKIDEEGEDGQIGDRSKGHSNDRSKISLFGSHIFALAKKRMLTFRRDKKMWAWVVVMPAVFISIGAIIVLSVKLKNMPSLTLTPSSYNSGGAPFPYATDCTVAEGQCDPSVLMESLTFPGSARSVSLDINASTQPEEAVGKLNAILLSEASSSYDDTVYGAVSFRQADTTTATFDYTLHANYSALHSVPVYLNQMNSAMLRLLSGDNTLSITTVMHPMPETAQASQEVNLVETFYIVIFTLLAFSFVSAGWMMYIVRERETKCKHQQVVSGVGLEAYWLSSYLWDVLSFLIPAGFTLIIYVVADVSAVIDSNAAPATVLIFLLYGASMAPYTYLWSFRFKSHVMAQNVWLFHNFFMGVVAPTVVLMLPTKKLFDVVIGILRLCPHFAFAHGLIWLAFTNAYDAGTDDDYDSPPDAFHSKITGNDLIYMAVTAVGYFGLLLATERQSAGGSFLSRLCGKASVAHSLNSLHPSQLGEGDVVDEDVATEVRRIQQGGGDGDTIKIDSVSKVYPSSLGAKVAVKSTSLGIPRGECFGLLGINGAGKSSILSILAGEIPPTGGTALLNGRNIGEDPEAIHRLVGYCPQFDALFETLTGREHLRLYAAIKGISPSSKVEKAVETMVDEMGLRQYADKLAGGYSGGNKRKLSVAIAMIGYPQIVFLDEPSTGMDPMARRLMWNFIMRVVTQNKECAMILTTHSMEECEALCQRIGIMVGGRMRCLGSSQHLKTRFGKGFQLEARVGAVPTEEVDEMLAVIAEATSGQGVLTDSLLGPALDAAGTPEFAPEISAEGRGAIIYRTLAVERTVLARDFAVWLCQEKKCSRMIAFVERNFDGAYLQEKQNAKMRFVITPQAKKTLGDMFGLIEENASDLGVGEYALSQTSLEQIFNSFAAQQEEEQGRAAGMM